MLLSRCTTFALTFFQTKLLHFDQSRIPLSKVRARLKMRGAAIRGKAEFLSFCKIPLANSPGAIRQYGCAKMFRLELFSALVKLES